MEELPASTDAFVWLRLYQVEMAGLIPGVLEPLWWTLRRPVRPLTYHAVHRMFERVNQKAGTAATLHSLRYCGLPYGRGSGPAADRRAARARPCPAHDHSDLPDAPQGGRGPPGPRSPCGADQAGGGAGAGRFAPGYRPETLDVLFGDRPR